MNDSTDTIVIVGAGQAAGELALSLRQQGHGGPIVMIGEESYIPYQRPPLSKAFLAGNMEIEGLYTKAPTAYANASVEFIGNARVERIDREAHTLHLVDGRQITYARLALTTGGRVRRLALPCGELADRALNVHYLRGIDDALRIREQFVSGARLVIVGGGYVGLEVAALARKKGLQVTVLEAMSRVLARVTAPEVSSFYERLHREEGVDIRLETAVEDLIFDAQGRATGVRCSSGETLPADLLIVGIGLIANTELAAQAGLAVDNGILVDEYCQTSDLDIVAAGDCTNHPSQYAGRRLRLESVPNALEQARVAAATLCGKRTPYHSVPWFWSDQYDLKLQMVGLSQGYDQVVLRGKPDLRSFMAFFLNEGRLIAVDAISRPQEFMVAKRLVAAGGHFDPTMLADEARPLKQLLETV